MRVNGAADAVDAEVGVVGEAVLARDPAQRGVNLATRLGHRDELCKNNILVTGGHRWSQVVTVSDLNNDVFAIWCNLFTW